MIFNYSEFKFIEKYFCAFCYFATITKQSTKKVALGPAQKIKVPVEQWDSYFYAMDLIECAVISTYYSCECEGNLKIDSFSVTRIAKL